LFSVVKIKAGNLLILTIFVGLIGISIYLISLVLMKSKELETFKTLFKRFVGGSSNTEVDPSE